ncbi:hypothetical protein COEREDRAFT_41813 [Coemansia reversa NRRL 1564]|uniref:NADH dehydrogenase [ubiquinone] 1 alpha subcomplex subunit 1 n=1 Tax=Coemansia reversa (strain ATCC 12441 / NRRL 1564) TaxID=763665 RepID=A0A2G5BD31_COERN|nr:hypothetical protein H4S08_003793 [Coemansia sp. RSA 1365]PIA16919.1 hypothetical protein COEREDRAFT_41813 [Coemansia reversa NRRL 1564]|eukprot:PIA16919.1 hypothetical protein COEREDRAFT_41813 [Coemansia reversa NRRL 1564]
MPVPFESFIPFGIMSAMFVVTGVGINFAQTRRNEGKKPRYSMDDWDRKMMTRDKQLTGTPRGQNDAPVAPPEFKINSSWKVYRSLRNGVL